MKTRKLLFVALLWFFPGQGNAGELLDGLSEALTFSTPDQTVRLRVSGAADLEYYHVSDPPFGLINTGASDLFNPRFTLFFDSQLGPKFYAFAQLRLDRGFDPSDDGAQVRVDEYALRFTPYEDGRLNIQVGKFSSIIGNWMVRHLSWDNPFINAPLPYEHLTHISDIEPPATVSDFTHEYGAEDAYEYNPVVWSAAYTSGISIAGRLGVFDYAAELKNAALSSRPDSWDVTQIGFDHPTIVARIGWRPNLLWNLGLSASRGPYMRPEASGFLPDGKSIGDYQQILLAHDVSFALGHFQLWAEIFASRFEVPLVGNADTLAYYVEAKYKITPALYVALRWNQQFFSDVPDGGGGRTAWGDDLWSGEAAIGYRLDTNLQIKAQYSLETPHGSGDSRHMIGLQCTLRF